MSRSGRLHRPGQADEGALARGVDDQVVSVGGLPLLGRHDTGPVVAAALSILVRQEVLRGMRAGLFPDRLVERHVDILADAAVYVSGAQGHHRAHGGEDAGAVVGDHVARPHGRTVGPAGLIGHAGEAQGDAVEAGLVAVGTGLSVAGDARHDQPRIAFAQRVGRQVHLLQRARPEVLDQHVGLRAEFAEQVLASGIGHVAGDASLRSILLDIADRSVDRLARPRPLQLDHVGAELGQHGRAVGRGEDLSGVDHGDAVERRSEVVCCHGEEDTRAIRRGRVGDRIA